MTQSLDEARLVRRKPEDWSCVHPSQSGGDLHLARPGRGEGQRMGKGVKVTLYRDIQGEDWGLGFVSHGRHGLEDGGKLRQCGHCDYIRERCSVYTTTSSFGEKS